MNNINSSSYLTTEEKELAQLLNKFGLDGEPSIMLDAKILANAKIELDNKAEAAPIITDIRTRVRKKPAYQWPALLGVAASLILSVGIVLQLRTPHSEHVYIEQQPTTGAEISEQQLNSSIQGAYANPGVAADNTGIVEDKSPQATLPLDDAAILADTSDAAALADRSGTVDAFVADTTEQSNIKALSQASTQATTPAQTSSNSLNSDIALLPPPTPVVSRPAPTPPVDVVGAQKSSPLVETFAPIAMEGKDVMGVVSENKQAIKNSAVEEKMQQEESRIRITVPVAAPVTRPASTASTHIPAPVAPARAAPPATHIPAPVAPASAPPAPSQEQAVIKVILVPTVPAADTLAEVRNADVQSAARQDIENNSELARQAKGSSAVRDAGQSEFQQTTPSVAFSATHDQEDILRVRQASGHINEQELAENAKLPAGLWFERIYQYKAQNNLKTARANLQRLVIKYPNTRIPEDLRPLLEE